MKPILLFTAILFSALLSAQAPNWTVKYFNPEQGASGATARYLHVDDLGYLWVGKVDGLWRFDGSEWSHYGTGGPDSVRLYASNVSCFYQKYPGELWFGTDGGGLHRFDLAANRIDHFTTSHGLPSDRVWSALYTADSVLLVGTEDGFGQLTNGQWQSIHIPLFAEHPSPYATRFINRVIEMIQDPGDPNIIWLGTASGLVKYMRDAGTFEYITMPDYPSPVELNSVRTYLTDNQGRIWHGTYGSGVRWYQPKTGRFEVQTFNNDPRLTINNQNIVHGMCFDSDGFLWIASMDEGLGKMDTSTKEIVWFSIEPSDTALDPRHKLTFDVAIYQGYLWIADRKGLFRLSGNPAWQNFPDALTARVGSVSAKNQLYQPNPYKPLEKLNLQRTSDFLQFHISVPHFGNKGDMEYQYRLEGLQDEWITQTGSNTFTFNRVPGGSYLLEIKGTNERTGQAIEPIHLEVFIPTSITQTIWFWIVLIGVALTVVLLAYTIRIRQVQKNAARETQFQRELARMELNALRAHMNPHFLFNALNSLKDYIISNDPKGASDYLGKFSKLMRLVLQNAQEPSVTLALELETLELYLAIEAKRFEGRFTYTIEADDSLKSVHIPPMLIHPYVENAIWHGLMHKQGLGQLTIEIEKQGKVLICTITDNGIGREAAAKLGSKSAPSHKSLGLEITQNRISLTNRLYHVNASVSIEDLKHADGSAAGTQVTLQIPILEG